MAVWAKLKDLVELALIDTSATRGTSIFTAGISVNPVSWNSLSSSGKALAESTVIAKNASLRDWLRSLQDQYDMA
jgi:hypothetical protein